MCDTGDNSLQQSLKQAAAQKLGGSIESAMRPDDLARTNAGSSSMAKALLEAKERLKERKAVLGEEAALAELDASIRDADRTAARPRLLKARPKLWLLDRDGCINEDVGAPGVIRAEDLKIIPGSAGAVRRLRSATYGAAGLRSKVAIITNQSCRGLGLLSAAGLDEIHEALRHLLATTARGGLVGREQWDGLYICEDAERSDRKKPEPGMILEALADFECAPSEAVMIGDSWSDVVAAQRAGCVGVLLATGHGASLGALLKAQGVQLPITLAFEDDGGEAAATDFAKLQRSLTSMRNANGAAARAVEEWIGERSPEEGALVAEALKGREGVRVYADLAQAVDELVAIASEL